MSCRSRGRVVACPLLLVLLVALLTSPLVAEGTGDLADPEPIQLKAARLPDEVSAPTLDGKVIDEAWLKVDPYSAFIQTDPLEGAPASEQTEVRVLYDRTTLYIG